MNHTNFSGRRYGTLFLAVNQIIKTYNDFPKDGYDDWCYGFIDVNGQKGPNRIVRCDSAPAAAGGTGAGTTASGTPGADDYACTVTNPTDIYPIAFYNQSVIPA